MRDHSRDPEWALERARDRVQCAAIALTASQVHNGAFPEHSDGVSDLELSDEIFQDTLTDFALLYAQVHLS